jgi:hypothetical protein
LYFYKIQDTFLKKYFATENILRRWRWGVSHECTNIFSTSGFIFYLRKEGRGALFCYHNAGAMRLFLYDNDDFAPGVIGAV